MFTRYLVYSIMNSSVIHGSDSLTITHTFTVSDPFLLTGYPGYLYNHRSVVQPLICLYQGLLVCKNFAYTYVGQAVIIMCIACNDPHLRENNSPSIDGLFTVNSPLVLPKRHVHRPLARQFCLT